jgi:phenylalanyl-tRNA synthetase alpha chain
VKEALTALDQAHDEAALCMWQAVHLSKKSPLMMALGDLGKLPHEQRAEIGKYGNEVKRALEAAFAEKEQAIQTAALERSLKENAVLISKAPS